MRKKTVRGIGPADRGPDERGRVMRANSKPELLAVRPNQVWSWDITKLKGPANRYFQGFELRLGVPDCHPRRAGGCEFWRPPDR